MMNEIVTSKGILKYRMPNILEAYDLLEESGVLSGVTSATKLKRNIISNMGMLIDFSGVDGAESYNSLLEDVENMIHPLGEIADEVIIKTFAVFKKKSS